MNEEKYNIITIQNLIDGITDDQARQINELCKQSYLDGLKIKSFDVLQEEIYDKNMMLINITIFNQILIMLFHFLKYEVTKKNLDFLDELLSNNFFPIYEVTIDSIKKDIVKIQKKFNGSKLLQSKIEALYSTILNLE